MLQRAASNAYSWWYASHVRTKQSKWLEQSLQDMGDKVEAVLKLIEEDGDSFAKRAEMYYKKRPELINFVEESYRAYRSLAERYDHLSKELQNANNTLASAFPDQYQFPMDDDDDYNTSKMPRKFQDRSPNPNIPQAPQKFPTKNIKAIMALTSKLKNNPAPRNMPKSGAHAKRLPKSGLTITEAINEIDKLQKQILTLQTEKEFAKSSYENGYAKYWDIEEQISTTQEKISKLQDEFEVAQVIEDDEARTLMAEAAIKSCNDTLAQLQEKQERAAVEAKEEQQRIKDARNKLNSLKGEFHRWIDLMHKCKKTAPYIVTDSRAYLDHDMFAIMSGPTIAAISVVFDHAEQEDVYRTCIDGFLAVAKISACHHLEDVLDDLVVSLCKFTTLLNPSSIEEPVLAFGDDMKARMATVTVFTIANRYGNYIRAGWRNILDCILRLHKLGLLPARVASDAADDSELTSDPGQGKPLTNSLSASHLPSMGTPRRSSGLMGRFSQLLSLETEEPRSQPTEQQLAAHQRTLQTIQKCHIDTIFTESKFLQAESLLQLARALIWAAGRPQKGAGSPEDEDTAVFCLELLIAITLNNRDRIVLLWQGVYEHIANIVQSTVMPCALVEKAVFGLLRICQRLLPYKENLADELLKSLQLVLKLDARVADAYCEQVTQEVTRLVKANSTHIRSQMGWRTITSLLSVTARHPEASEPGFDALVFIMSEGAHMQPSNFILCVDAARQFAESRVGQSDRSIRALDLMAGSVGCLVKWVHQTKEAGEDAVKMSQDIGEMWLRLVQALRKVCLDQREEVRNHAVSSLQKCLTEVDEVHHAHTLWLQCFDMVIFTMLDDLLEIAQGHSQKDYRNMEGTLTFAVKLLPKVFLQLLPELSQLTTFCKLWLGVLSRMEKYMKVKIRGKKSEKLQNLVLELLKKTLVEMKNRGVLVQRSALGGDSLWELTWLHVNNISPSLQSEIYPSAEVDGNNNATPPEPVVSEG